MTDPKDTNNPFSPAAMASYWAEAARTTTQAMQAFLDASAKAFSPLQQQAPGDAAAEARKAVERWAAAAARLTALQPQFLERWLADLPQAAGKRLDAQTFSQLGRFASTRWTEELRRLAEAAQGGAPPAVDVDTERTMALFQSMSAEYLRDLETLKSVSFVPNLDHIVEAWTKLLQGGEAADEASARTVDRLLRATATKLAHGAEVYADPAETKIGLTPREAVHRLGKITLYRYLPPEGAAPRRGDPVLLVYSVINRPYILDLMPGYSFIEHLLGQGLDVYLIDWGETDPGDERTLDEYIDPGIQSCVDAIKARTGAERVSLFGHCIGGNLALLHAALHPTDVGRIITLTTPAVASKGGVAALWADRNLFPIDAIVGAFGHMPAKLIRYTFIALKPYYEVLKWRMFVEQLHDDAVMKIFYTVDRWANDNVDVPGPLFKKFVCEVLLDDRFVTGKTQINGKTADLKAITCPVLNLAAANDWIVPPHSAQPINAAVGSADSRFTLIQGGHVSIMFEPHTRKHWTEMSDFLLGPPPPAAK